MLAICLTPAVAACMSPARLGITRPSSHSISCVGTGFEEGFILVVEFVLCPEFIILCRP